MIYVQSANNFFAALDDADEAKSKVTASSSSAAKKPSNSGSKVTAANKSAPPSSNKGKGGRGGGSGDRNTKFGRSGRGPAREGKREYDRRSGTGRGKETKKGGGGARNWGSDKNEAKKLEGTIDEDRIGEEAVADGQEPAADVEAVEPVQDNTMTLAEYMASKNAGKSEETTREVENEFSGKAAAVKKEEEDFFSAGGKKKRVKKKKEEEKKTVDVGFRVVRFNHCHVFVWVCGCVLVVAVLPKVICLKFLDSFTLPLISLLLSSLFFWCACNGISTSPYVFYFILHRPSRIWAVTVIVADEAVVAVIVVGADVVEAVDVVTVVDEVEAVADLEEEVAEAGED